MIWKGNKKYKESKTDDGYHLVAVYINENKYSWIVYKDNRILKNPNAKSVFKKNMGLAQKHAIRLMIQHILKKID